MSHPKYKKQFADVNILLSGGIDSAAAAHFYCAKGHNVRGIFVDYGQAASNDEWHSAQALASGLSIDLQKLDCPMTSKFGSGEIMGRNAFLITAAVFLGRIENGLLSIGVHAGTSYYDCSLLFFNRMKTILEEQSGGSLTLSAPFLTWSKPQIIQYFMEADLPLELTYSCELGKNPPCGSCKSCRDREMIPC